MWRGSPALGPHRGYTRGSLSDLLFYQIGRGSLVEAKRSLEEIGRGASIAVYLDRLDPMLYRELLRWKRRQLIASLRGDDPTQVDPPVTMRPHLLAAYIRSRSKLVVSDSEFVGGWEGGEEEGRGPEEEEA